MGLKPDHTECRLQRLMLLEFDCFLMFHRVTAHKQPVWTLVGAGVFNQADAVKTMASLIPARVE